MRRSQCYDEGAQQLGLSGPGRTDAQSVWARTAVRRLLQIEVYGLPFGSQTNRHGQSCAGAFPPRPQRLNIQFSCTCCCFSNLVDAEQRKHIVSLPTHGTLRAAIERKVACDKLSLSLRQHISDPQVLTATCGQRGDLSARAAGTHQV